MSIIKWEPFEEIDRFFDDFPSLNKMGRDYTVDVYEKDNNIVAEMSLPRIDPEKIDVFVEDNYLRISGSREEENEDEGKQYYNKEIRRGSFERVVRLPTSVDMEQVKANFKNGELSVVLPKSSDSPKNKVKIEVLE